MDESGIKNIAGSILNDTQNESMQELETYLSTDHTKSSYQVGPLSRIKKKPLTHWLLDDIPIQQELSFPSTLKRKNGDPDTAIFYLYSNTGLRRQKVILWIPGFGVSDLAFRFIKTFFINELNAGYSVLFYNIPYHLNRIEDGDEMGEGVFTSNNQKNLELVKHVQYEMRTAVNYLNSENVKSISGWGGSVGAAYLWLASETIHFDHMTLMIPIVDWTTIIFHEHMQEVVKRMNSAGVSER
ncbi:MAG: hypothetical protein HQ517_03415 [SAR324 cluster bacterium]|nr:hypothetical protein [SAR324 cluster bacterium]